MSQKKHEEEEEKRRDKDDLDKIKYAERQGWQWNYRDDCPENGWTSQGIYCQECGLIYEDEEYDCPNCTSEIPRTVEELLEERDEEDCDICLITWLNKKLHQRRLFNVNDNEDRLDTLAYDLGMKELAEGKSESLESVREELFPNKETIEAF